MKEKKQPGQSLDSIESPDNQSYIDWLIELLPLPDVSSKTMKVRIRKALECSKSLSAIKNHNNLEPFISRRSMDTHTFVASWKSLPLL